MSVDRGYLSPFYLYISIMKLRFVLVGLLLGCISVFATDKPKRNVTGLLQDQSLYEVVSGKEKKHDWLHVYFDMHAGFNLNFHNGLDNGRFSVRDLKISAKGTVTPWLSYSYCQRLNRSNDGVSRADNLPASIDYALVSLKPMAGLTLNLGKQCAAFGGYEFDMLPIEVYEFSDILEHMDCYMTGATLIWNMSDKQELQMQLLNGLNNSAEETFGKVYQSQASKVPLLYALNWNGSLGGAHKSRWSVSAMNELKGEWLYYVAIGNSWTFSDVDFYIDAMYSHEGVDKSGIVSMLIPEEKRTGASGLSGNVRNTRYFSLVSRLNYHFAPKWNAFAKGMYDTAGVYQDSEGVSAGQYRTAWGYQAGVEFFPMKTNFRFFLTYTGRSYIHHTRALDLGARDYHTHRLSAGFVYQLPVF